MDRRRRAFSKRLSKRMWLLLGLLALLPGMAFMQYRWIGQVSDAARERAKGRLENSIQQLVTEFDAEITRAHMAFWAMPPGESKDPAQRFAVRYREWNRLAPYPQLIREAYLIDITGDTWVLSRIDSSGAVSRPAAWPPDLEALRTRLEENAQPGPGSFRRWMGEDVSLAGDPAFLIPLREPRAEDDRPRPPREDGDRPHGRWERPPRARTVGWAVVLFDAAYIRKEFLPELTRRTFQQEDGSDWDLLIEPADKPGAVIFQSALAAGHGEFSSPDASARLFNMRPDCFLSPGASPPGGPPQAGPGGMGNLFSVRTKDILTRKPSACGSMARALGKDDGKWRLLVKHRAGSLDQAFATFRLRTMAISFGVLLVLGLGVTMLTVSTERARVLAKLQMEFAMGVSHELRTPLTVIRVAADNLSNGMMVDAQHAKKYGQMIGDEARRLTDMVEQILTFARIQSGNGLDVEAVAPERIVRRALAACGPALREARMEIERFVEPDLPPVRVDEIALADCVQNLINNAVKYAAGGGWIRVRAGRGPGLDGGMVRISVEDRGPGIDPDDLPHIFDPFYRGEAVKSSQLPGVGLGLSLVKRIVEAQRGSVHVQSSPEAGACFCIDLPADATPLPAEPEFKEVVS